MQYYIESVTQSACLNARLSKHPFESNTSPTLSDNNKYEKNNKKSNLLTLFGLEKSKNFKVL